MPHKDKIKSREYHKKYKKTPNGKRINRKYCKKYYWKNVKKESKRHRDYILRNKEKIKENNKKLRLNALTYYGGNPPKCNCCGEKEIKFLTIDHINGGGYQHTKRVGSIYKWLERNNYPLGFQILCWNCNCAKGLYGKCPHEI